MTTAPLAADEFTAAFARHGRPLWLLAAAWVGRGDAQDLVQEAARIAWQKRATFTAGSELGAWLAQIVRHTGANWRRKRRPLVSGDCPEPLAPAERPPLGLLGAASFDLPDELHRALQNLSEVARAALLLHVVLDLPFATIATMLDIPENTAQSHARRARLALREALAPANGLPAATAGPGLRRNR